MTNDSSTILAIGAAGKFAGMVVPALTKRGARVRGFVTDAKQSLAVRSHGAAEVAVGDLRDETSVDAALKGVGAVFYIAPAFLPNEAAVGRHVVASAIRAGVRRFVFSSVIHPVLTELENHAAKIPVEEALLDSNMEFVFLHPAMFFQNYAQSWPNVLKTGVLAEPWSIDTGFSRVDYRDVAEVAAIALTENGLNFGTFELCAEGHLNRTDVAQIMSEVLGRGITAAKSEIPKNKESASSAGEDPQNSAIQKMFRWYDSHGLLGNSFTLHAILGREPRTLRLSLKISSPEPGNRSEPGRTLDTCLAPTGADGSTAVPYWETGNDSRRHPMNQGRIVVITGAAGGMGALFVERFLANRDTVIATDTSEEALGKLTKKLDAGVRLHTMTADISDEASCAKLAAFARDKAGRVDVLINCAGFFPTQSFDEMVLADWNKVIDINLTGVFLMVKAMLPLMKGRGWGRIVNIGSGSMFEGVAEQTHYVAAKTGVLGFSRSLARVVGKEGITVNVVAPGLTLTPAVAKSMPPEMVEAQVKARAIQRDEKGEDLVGTVFFLASPDADFMSGQTLNVDGGKHML